MEMVENGVANISLAWNLFLDCFFGARSIMTSVNHATKRAEMQENIQLLPNPVSEAILNSKPRSNNTFVSVTNIKPLSAKTVLGIRDFS